MLITEHPLGHTVRYARHPNEVHTKRFTYGWHHLPSGKQGTMNVWCYNVGEFDLLLASWNLHQNWQYNSVTA